MDANYGSRFQEWIRNEENLPASAPRLKRIANQYSFKRLVPAFSYIIKSWRIVNIGKLLKTLCEDWSGNKGHEDRGILIGRLTENWPSEYVASLVCDFLTSKPYILCDSSSSKHQEAKLELLRHKVTLDISKARFLKALTRDYSLDRVKAVCSRLGPFNSRTGIPYANFRADQPIVTQIAALESSMSSNMMPKDVCVIDWQIPVAIVKLARRKELQKQILPNRLLPINPVNNITITGNNHYNNNNTGSIHNVNVDNQEHQPYNFVFGYPSDQPPPQQTYGYPSFAFSQ
ncbi:463_t:CDS:2 [Ambispora gerdemannii]|uniref:463_t:CDS:1 n=1 Tax=Ambispora gerdemannii TaxID=144530 RepID=A0A9N9ATW3_9GLOM|nr:463_t:CDS:2 [Ambispora gerdemannii]